MNWLDILALVVLVGAGLMGWKVGLVRGVLTFGGLVAGVFLAGRLGPAVGERLAFLTDPDASRVAGFVIVLIGSVIAGWLLGILIRTILRTLMLGWVDGLGGATLGVLSGSFLITGLVIAFSTLPFGGFASSLKDSQVARGVVDTFPFLLSLVPEDYRGLLALKGRVEAPSLGLQEVAVTEASSQRVTFQVRLAVSNPNPFGGGLEQATVAVTWLGPQEYPLGQGSLKRLPIPSGEKTLEVEVSTEASSNPIVPFFYRALTEKGSVRLRVQGEATILFLSERFSPPFQEAVTLRYEQ